MEEAVHFKGANLGISSKSQVKCKEHCQDTALCVGWRWRKVGSADKCTIMATIDDNKNIHYKQFVSGHCTHKFPPLRGATNSFKNAGSKDPLVIVDPSH